MSATLFETLSELGRAMRLRRGPLRQAERATRDELLAKQRQGLERMLAHAVEHSPFYRARWNGRTPTPADFRQLEPLTRDDLSVHLDALLTDRSLNRETLYGWLGEWGHPYVVVGSSGTSGEPVVVPYSRQTWRRCLAHFLRGSSRINPNPLSMAWNSRRTATFTTRNPIHISSQMLATLGGLSSRALSAPADTPIGDLVEQVQRFQPTWLGPYPSVVNQLAKAQLAGELNIEPRGVSSGAETLPAGFRDRVREAWQVEVVRGLRAD